ncbi:MAG: enoyl-CoA hydratase/isomerase family protein [Alphaproteobacteria bacterium]|nr:enoyl-CoA hydratase/isomerase family protein [Alphaproteobacteria bacterium]
MKQGFPTDEILTEVQGGLGVISLNRPAALNALSLGMIRKISEFLQNWEKLDNVKAVLFQAAPWVRAFCSGGDMKAFYRAGMAYRRAELELDALMVFFAEEYALNRFIFNYKKPTIAFMDGLTMGGGYGIGGNCRYRVVTQNTVFAMPEVRIGFFPDVGSVYHLTRAKGHLGRYLALTGNSIKGADMVQTGLAEYFVDSAFLGALRVMLSTVMDEMALKAALVRCAREMQTEDFGILHSHGAEIETLFSDMDPLMIVKKGRAGSEGGKPSAFAVETARDILVRSPVSVLVACAYMKRADSLCFDEVMAMDFILARNFAQGEDLYEGLRAVLIDKDKKPQWSAPGLENVRAEIVNAYFT